MINSLLKDSHMTQSFCYRYSGTNAQNRSKKQDNNIVNNGISVNISKPARNVSFCGLAGAKLANETCFNNLMAKVTKLMPETKKLKDIKKAVKASINDLAEEKQDFTKQAKPELEETLNKLKSFIKIGDKTPEELSKEINAEIDAAIDGHSILSKGEYKGGIYTSRHLKKFFELADSSKAVFSAVYALWLTCLLRPATIMALPSDKKNKDDNTYASAHSMASGIIGALASTVILLPISKGMLKLKNNPSKFIKNENSYLIKGSRKVKDTAQTAVNMLSDTVFSIPKGILTVSLIPIVLKNVFGMEKKKTNADKNAFSIVNNPAALNQNKIEVKGGKA